MPTIQIGQVIPAQKGIWNETSKYIHYDWVIYNGSAYLAIQDVPTGVPPILNSEVNVTYWVLFGAKGDQGEPGPSGGGSGGDYITNALIDKNGHFLLEMAADEGTYTVNAEITSNGNFIFSFGIV